MIDLFVKLFPAAVAALSLVGILVVAFRLQKLDRVVASLQQKDMDSIISVVVGLKAELANLSERLSSLESESRETSPAVAIRPGMNLNKRSQALRRCRLGEASGDIAKSLDMHKTEVDLLLKVYRIVSQL